MKYFSKMEYEFKELEIKINRLKKIEKELNALYIIGFESDNIRIKSMLKDPDRVDEIEREFRSLENKIAEKKNQGRKNHEEIKQKIEKKERDETVSTVQREVIKKPKHNRWELIKPDKKNRDI